MDPLRRTITPPPQVVFIILLLQGGFRRGGLTPACGFAHARIGEERYDVIIGKAEAAQKLSTVKDVCSYNY